MILGFKITDVTTGEDRADVNFDLIGIPQMFRMDAVLENYPHIEVVMEQIPSLSH